MSVDAHISGSARQALVLSVLNVLPTLRINELLRQTKIDNVDDVFIWRAVSAHEEILGLYVTIDQVLAVDILNSGNLEREREREREREVGRVRETSITAQCMVPRYTEKCTKLPLIHVQLWLFYTCTCTCTM